MMTTVYGCYIVISLTIMIRTAMLLARHGRPFLVQVFQRQEPVADAVNAFLVVGYCLLNAGWIFITLRDRTEIQSVPQAIELLGLRVGTAILFLGGLHFFNLVVLCRIRDRRQA